MGGYVRGRGRFLGKGRGRVGVRLWMRKGSFSKFEMVGVTDVRCAVLVTSVERAAGGIGWDF